jgi:hypothetical protein
MSETEHPALAAYDDDFYAWAACQAELLRAGRLGEADIEHIAEEIESLGKSNWLSLSSHVRNILVHLMKLQASPAANPRHGWRQTVLNARAEIEDILEASPSLRRQLPDIILHQTPRARRLAAEALAEFGENPTQLAGLSYTVDQVLGPWLPD